MKTNSLWAVVACTAISALGFEAKAQDTVVVEEDVVSFTEVPCETRYYSTSRDNWFIQIGAGIDIPYFENYLNSGDAKHHITTAYNVGFGKWFSPYVGWRLSFLGGAMHWDQGVYSKAKYVNANLDFMWDMFNSLGGVNSKRVFSIVPFVGLGGAYVWDFAPKAASQVYRDNGHKRTTSWTLPVSAGIQLRFRLSKYVDFFAEGRALFAGDNFNNNAVGKPIDINVTAIGGFSFNIGGAGFRTYNPCDYSNYIAGLNDQVNELRGALAASTAALAVAESQLPCPEVQPAPAPVVQGAPMMATVRFKINSAKISNEEMVNVYNVAEYLKANPDQKLAIVGYADKDTGTAEYNMGLSKRRAEAVRDVLVNKYGINPDRLTINAEGSAVQPYDVNNWNRIVIFEN